MSSQYGRNTARKEAALSALLFLFTAGLFIGGLWVSVEWILNTETRGILFWTSNAAYIGLIGIFTYGNSLYQISRMGYYLRLSSPSTLVDNFSADRYVVKNTSTLPPLSILVPSYKEDCRVIRQTLLSAALMGYSKKRVVLLLDDPPSAGHAAPHQQTATTVRMVNTLNRKLAEQKREFHTRCNDIERLLEDPAADPADIFRAVSVAYEDISQWFFKTSLSYTVSDHTDSLFRRKVFDEPSQFYQRKARALKRISQRERIREYFDHDYMLDEIRYIRALFDVDITIFQRKQYTNVSHEPNKAMNLNSYLSLMGGTYSTFEKGNAYKLVPHPGGQEDGDVTFPDSDYVITLDADSILDHHYAAKLVSIMQRGDSKNLAVIQTPYSAIPQTQNILERTAGITTDIQYIIHQGFTGYNATYWVGANALLRKQALNDIKEPVSGQPLMERFIQDRTVIEDTESSIDLINKGWKLYNYPERLAYSATPPDYGSLVTQRRRWANGGLIILPKLIKYLCKRPSLHKLPEGFLRLHYLTSIAMISAGLILMLFIPVNNFGFSVLFILTAGSYFYLYYRDMRLLDYGLADLLRVYSLNLILLPIHAGGVLKSLHQMITGEKTPFGRTPKVNKRTAAPIVYHTATYGLIGYMSVVAFDYISGGHLIFAAAILLNLAFIVYGAKTFIGFRNSASDVKVKLDERAGKKAEQ